jgi:CBS domain-containing protein
MTKAVTTIDARLPAREVITKYFSTVYKHRGYPVIDEQGEVLGILTISDMLDEARLQQSEESTARDLIRRETVMAYSDEMCRVAAERMALNGVGRLPVLSSQSPHNLVGIITRSDLLKPRLSNYEEEQNQERYLSLSVFRGTGL